MNDSSPGSSVSDRSREWFVPRFGSPAFRRWAGLLFLPYTAMVLSYTVLGASLAGMIHWDRVAALALIYFLGLGLGAHSLDAIGRHGRKPWGDELSKTSLRWVAACSLLGAYGIGAFYMIRFAPLLWPIAIAEGFFAFAYNLEWFGGRFHRDGWFALSWGALPALAGYVLQTNRISAASVCLAGALALISLIEITLSRPYKELRRGGHAPEDPRRRYETALKSLSAAMVLLGMAYALARAGL